MRSAQAANALVGTCHVSWSTSWNTGASVLSVASSLKQQGPLAYLPPSTPGGKASIGPYRLSSRAAVARPIPGIPG
jgi:hypothetical protein